jgi:hypothetical protein
MLKDTLDRLLARAAQKRHFVFAGLTEPRPRGSDLRITFSARC